MDNKEFYNLGKTKSDPASRNYSKEVNNKAHEKSPFGDDEPSSHTEFKKKRH